MKLSIHDVRFRPISQADFPFLLRLYQSTRVEEMKLIPDWTKQQKSAFVKQQFEAQHTFYQKQFGDAQFDLILIDDQPVGRLYQEQRKDEIRVIDITLIPEFRNQGLGKKLMLGIMQKARNLDLAVRIHVELNNPAMHLYERLGFKKIGDSGVYYLMEWNPKNHQAHNGEN
ncbi:MAG: GNAT family N-acetyltransferase [Saprospiraceae bacterium]|nr:GNAT family N-acetyltransferase [Saprospiraceae bacterium]